MSNEATILRIRAQVENLEGLNRARSAVRNFATESKAASNDLDKLRSLFKELGSESVRSVNNLKNYRTGLDALRQSAQIGSTTFNELTAEIKQLDIELGTLQGKQAQVASGFNKIASSANAAATATRRQFDLSGAGVNFGKTTVAGQTYTIRDTKGQGQPFGPQAIDYAAVNKGLTQAVQAEEQLTELSRRARMERLLNAEKYNNLEIAAADKKAREELRIQQQGNARAEADFDRRLAARGRNKGNLQKFGQTAGAIAASGVFGGPEGFIGAGIGAFAGPGGALAGGAIGAQLGMVRQQIGDMTEYAAQVGRLQIALQGVTKTSAEYASAQEAIFRISRDLNVPTLEATKGFTQLSASVLGAGGKVNDAEIVFRGFSQAIKATGGGAEQVSGAMTALTQIFAKGKISAEEINQIAERLPGAFTAIAKATGMSGAELQEALKKGQVGLNDLMKTAQYLTDQYSASADKMAKSTDDAGARMKVALDELGKNFGEFFKPVGAGIQDLITKLANFANEMFRTAQLTNKLKDFSKGLTPANESALTSDAERIARLRVLGRNRRDLPMNQLTNDEQGRVTQAIYGSSYGALTKSGGIYGELRRDYMTRQLYGLKALTVPTAAQTPTNFAAPTVAGESNKAAEKAAQRLKERIQEQLIASRELIETERAGLNVSKASTAMKEIEEKNKKIQIETQKFYNNLLRKSLSDEERENILIAKRIAVRRNEADAIKRVATERSKALAEENRQRYAEAGLLDVLTEKRQGALAGAFTGGTALGTFRTDINLMPEITGGELGQKIEELRKSLEELNNPISQIIVGAERIGTAFGESFTGLINGSMSAQESLANFFRSVANHFLDMAMRMISKYVEMQVLGLAQQFFPNMFGSQFGFKGNSFLGSAAFGAGFQAPAFSLNANGNVFAQNGIVPFANGGIVDRPMMFPFAKGIGLMGEAGPEAIMPLKRGADGKLGVAGGGGGTSVTVNVDASGSSVQGNNGQSAALGRAIAASVQAELVKQKRPGGLLA